eukprot:57271-Pyramimonas_sp.AAC.5
MFQQHMNTHYEQEEKRTTRLNSDCVERKRTRLGARVADKKAHLPASSLRLSVEVFLSRVGFTTGLSVVASASGMA